MTADQPLSENSIARGGVGGGLIVIRYSNTCLKSFRTISLNNEGMLRGTDNFYFILRELFITMIIVIISGRCFLPIVVIIIVITPEEV